MTNTGTAKRARRTARLVQALQARKAGSTIRQLIDATGGSRATIYRDLELLRENGYAIVTRTVGGEARHCIEGSELALRAASPREHAALVLALNALSPLAGIAPVSELSRTLAGSRGNPTDDPRVSMPVPAPRVDPAVLATIQDACQAQRQLQLRYRGAKDSEPRPRLVHPIELTVVDLQSYLIAWDPAAKSPRDRGLRTFKAIRISYAKKRRERCRIPAAVLEQTDPKARSVKVWNGAPLDVRIRIDRAAARYVDEWPLVPDQRLEHRPDGSVDVCARVYGLEETMRWVLRWGRNAHALAPLDLQHKLASELGAALAGYEQAPAQRRG